MPPPPDANGPPEPAQAAPNADGSPLTPTPSGAEAAQERPSKAPTQSHQPAQSNPLSDILRAAGTGSSRRTSGGSDILQLFQNPGPLPIPGAPLGIENTDDSPTVITQPKQPGSAPASPPLTPLPLAGGDPPTITGRRLGNYELIEAVGAGGMAAVLKARDLELGRVVALKILPPEAARDPESVNRFKQEARAAARLDHDNVARVYACGEDQGLHFIAFEFVEGINLRQMIDRRGTVPAADCIRYMVQVAAGLNHAAERSVVHRDIKPSNIVITPDGRAKIVDMGLARQLEAGSVNGELTQSGVTLGTFDYISPEQALDPRRADVRSDIYSLGCTFYHALSGRPPVPEGTAAKKLQAHQHTEPLDPRELNPTIPDELVAVLARMMAKDPEQRYQTPTELIAHLKSLAERLRISADVIGQDSTVQAVTAEPSLPQPPRLRLGWVLAAAAAVGALTAFALSTGDNPQRPVAPPWSEKPGGGTPDVATVPQPGINPNVAKVDDGVVRDVKELAQQLADPDTKTLKLAAGVFDLTTLAEPIAFRGKELHLAASETQPTTLRVYPGFAGSDATGSFQVLGCSSLTVTGVRFEVVPQPGRNPTGAAVALTDVGFASFTDCVFTNALSGDARRAGNLHVAAGLTHPSTQVRVERCVFAPGAFALLLPEERCTLSVFDCGFGPHDVAIQVGQANTLAARPAEGASQNVSISLERSSFMLDPDSAVVANPAASRDKTDVVVRAGHCVFAAVPAGAAPFIPTGMAMRRPAIVRAQNRATEVLFAAEGKEKNAYYNVPALATASDVGAGENYRTFEQCKTEELPISDDTAVALKQRPWAEKDPVLFVASRDPWAAFRLDLDREPAVFVSDPSVTVVGAQFHNPNADPRWRAYPRLTLAFPAPPRSPVSPEKRTFVWFPDSKDEVLPANTSTDLAALLRKVQSGDTILIRTEGKAPVVVPVERVEVKPRALADPGTFSVTFKPFPGSAPILTVPGANNPKDRLLNQTLFSVHSGSAKFEGLQFLLRPSHPQDGQQVAAVQLIGAESCSFTDCVFTLAEADDSKAAVVTVVDPKEVMAMAVSAQTTPKVKFERCVIRGKGRGVWVKASRAVEVDAANALTALDGPLYLAEPKGAASGTKSTLKLTRVTAFIGGPLVELHGGKVGEMRLSGLVPLEVHTEECLFADVPFAGRSLVEFDGIDPSEANKLLPWEVVKANRYANFAASFDAMLVRPATEGTTIKLWNWDQWISTIGEKDGKPLGKVAFENAPATLDKLGAVVPADVVIKSVEFPDVTGAKPTDAGADPKALPIPLSEEK